jgi:hypothetical protein
MYALREGWIALLGWRRRGWSSRNIEKSYHGSLYDKNRENRRLSERKGIRTLDASLMAFFTKYFRNALPSRDKAILIKLLIAHKKKEKMIV